MVRTADVEETADVIAQIATQEARRIARLAAPRGRTPGRVAMDVLPAIPSVGDRRARRLLDMFGSVAAVVAASDEELLDTPDVGPVTVRSLRRTLGAAAGGEGRRVEGAGAAGPPVLH